MLQILRNKAQSTIIQTLVLIIALVFIFWGVGTNIKNSRDAAITINNEEITFQEFQRSYEQTITSYRQQFGDAISDEMLKNLGVKQQVINQLTQGTLLRQGANAMGIAVTPVEIQSTIQKMPQFQKDGAFNMEAYKAILTANRLTPHKFETSIGHDMLGEKGITFISNFATTVSPAEINELYQRDQEAVTVNVVKLSPAQFSNTITVDPQELATWFENEKNKYKTEQKIKLKYLPFPYKLQKESITISDEQVLAQYEKDKASFQIPEKRRARHILFRTEPGSSPEQQEAQMKKAKDVLVKAKAGEDFAALAKTWSEDPAKDRGGDLGEFTRGSMVKEFEDAAFSLQPGAVSDIVKTQFGYHIIKLEKILPAVTKPLEEARASIVAKLKTEQAKPLTFQLANEAYENIISAGSLQAYAEKHPEHPVAATDFFSRTTPPPTLDRDPKFLETVFALKQGELSSLVETPSGYFILFAEEIQEPTPPQLDEVRDRATADFKLSKARKMAADTAAALLTRAREKGDLAAIAGEEKLPVQQSGPLRKNAPTPDPILPAALVSQAMLLGAKAPFPKEALTAGDDLFLLQFLKRDTPELATLSEAARKTYTDTLLKQKQDQLLGAWLKRQGKNSKILTNKNI